ncbi:MAG: hypothetical protein V6Z89_23300 [Desulfobacter sp.]
MRFTPLSKKYLQLLTLVYEIQLKNRGAVTGFCNPGIIPDPNMLTDKPQVVVLCSKNIFCLTLLLKSEDAYG